MSILDYYKYAALATASYVRLGGRSWDGKTFSQEASSDDQARLPLSLAQYLFDPQPDRPNALPWLIQSYYAGDLPGSTDRTGFAATLFQQGPNGEKVLAMRGTEPLEDGRVDLVQADLAGIGILGLSLPQAVSMVNYILRLRAGPGDTHVPQFHIQTSFSPLSEFSVPASGSTISPEGMTEPVTIYIDLSVTSNGAGLGLIGPDDKVTLSGILWADTWPRWLRACSRSCLILRCTCSTLRALIRIRPTHPSYPPVWSERV